MRRLWLFYAVVLQTKISILEKQFMYFTNLFSGRFKRDTYLDEIISVCFFHEHFDLQM